MTRRQKDPLRPLAAEERAVLERVSRAASERADRVARARALLAVADGAAYTVAATAAGRRSGDGVAQLVRRFNQQGLAALDARHGGGPAIQYGAAERERILVEVRRTPDRTTDGTATWSLATLQRALRRAPDGLPQVSTATILQTLHAAGYTFQRSRTWCHTGTARRKRKDGTVVTVTDPDATPKKTGSRAPIGWGKRWGCRSGAKMKRDRIKPSRRRAPRGSRSAVRPSIPTSTSAAGRPNC